MAYQAAKECLEQELARAGVTEEHRGTVMHSVSELVQSVVDDFTKVSPATAATLNCGCG